jgi:hypothetical protein
MPAVMHRWIGHAFGLALGQQMPLDPPRLVAALDLDETANFVMLRQRVRDALAASSAAEEINQIVVELLG